MRQSIFTDFQPRHAQLFGKHSVSLGHRLHESELFSDTSLARLIELTPRHAYHVNTMDVTMHDPRTRREGVIEGLSGAEALEAVQKGDIWILLQQPHEVEGAYGHMLSDVYAEIEERVPGFEFRK
jgi:hypothetical protein